MLKYELMFAGETAGISGGTDLSGNEKWIILN